MYWFWRLVALYCLRQMFRMYLNWFYKLFDWLLEGCPKKSILDCIINTTNSLLLSLDVFIKFLPIFQLNFHTGNTDVSLLLVVDSFGRKRAIWFAVTLTTAPTNQPTYHCIGWQPTYQPTYQPNTQPTIQPTKLPNNHSTNQPNNHAHMQHNFEMNFMLTAWQAKHSLMIYSEQFLAVVDILFTIISDCLTHRFE